jgi:hypothetical protein
MYHIGSLTKYICGSQGLMFKIRPYKSFPKSNPLKRHLLATQYLHLIEAQ